MRGKDITSLSLQFQEDSIVFMVDINFNMKKKEVICLLVCNFSTESLIHPISMRAPKDLCLDSVTN
jgi:hypothetical protein